MFKILKFDWYCKIGYLSILNTDSYIGSVGGGNLLYKISESSAIELMLSIPNTDYEILSIDAAIYYVNSVYGTSDTTRNGILKKLKALKISNDV